MQLLQKRKRVITIGNINYRKYIKTEKQINQMNQIDVESKIIIDMFHDVFLIFIVLF